jgi:hypothetical protein
MQVAMTSMERRYGRHPDELSIIRSNCSGNEKNKLKQ